MATERGRDNLTKIQSEDMTLNRVQDHLMAVMNPALRQMTELSRVQTQHTATLATLTSAPAVTGSRGGNAALASLLTALDGLGVITDQTVP